MAAKVAIVRCDDYAESNVSAAVDRGFALLGGPERFVTEPGERILLKPNLLVASAPESCVTTHPTVFGAVARVLRDAGAHLTYGDSPGFGSTAGVARKAGLAQIAEEMGIGLADFREGREVDSERARLVRTWHLANGVLDSDGIVNLPKMKTHGLTRLTGAVKNLFGCVPGLLKGEFHARMTDVDLFSQMLVDLALTLPARLHVMDAVVAMEGNGPRSGDPRPVRALLFSEDPVALDATACRLMSLDPLLVGTCLHGQAFGLGSMDALEYLGDPLEEFVVPDFVANRSHASTTGSGRVSRFMRRWVVPKPVIRPALCTACGTCVHVCPLDPKAVDWTTAGGSGAGMPPEHDHSRCTRCYCCQEMCPERAIEIEVPLLGRLIHR